MSKAHQYTMAVMAAISPDGTRTLWQVGGTVCGRPDKVSVYATNWEEAEERARLVEPRLSIDWLRRVEAK